MCGSEIWDGAYEGHTRGDDGRESEYIYILGVYMRVHLPRLSDRPKCVSGSRIIVFFTIPIEPVPGFQRISAVGGGSVRESYVMGVPHTDRCPIIDKSKIHLRISFSFRLSNPVARI